jgi:hypothetical protein
MQCEGCSHGIRCNGDFAGIYSPTRVIAVTTLLGRRGVGDSLNRTLLKIKTKRDVIDKSPDNLSKCLLICESAHIDGILSRQQSPLREWIRASLRAFLEWALRDKDVCAGARAARSNPSSSRKRTRSAQACCKQASSAERVRTDSGEITRPAITFGRSPVLTHLFAKTIAFRSRLDALSRYSIGRIAARRAHAVGIRRATQRRLDQAA